MAQIANLKDLMGGVDKKINGLIQQIQKDLMSLVDKIKQPNMANNKKKLIKPSNYVWIIMPLAVQK